jgi:UDP-N-acetylmuramoyl-L-alanyl-D-glutamate--2,6-diaminopimelate ligase
VPTATERSRFARAHKALQTVAITGTNGKTTTTSMVAAIVAASGQTSSHLTTLGSYVGLDLLPPQPAKTEFLYTVEAAIGAGVTTFALEVTSKALQNGWAQQWPANIAVFTNLSRDHLDMHGSAEAYFAAKAQLFMHVAPGGHCVLNAADENTTLLAETIPEHATIHYYNAHTEDAKCALSARSVKSTRAGLEIRLGSSSLADAFGGCLQLPIVGDVHASNALAAALAAHSAGISPEAIKVGLAKFRGVAGRFEVVGTEPLTVVDYAHTPDGLRGTLTTARGLVRGQGRLLLVFGCGGERDRGKRPIMAEVAHAIADAVIVTNDNPRREAPEAIAEQIRSGAKGPGASWSLCLDRPEAVRQVVLTAHPDDVIIIAGKGHEQVQELADSSIAMCDHKLASAALLSRTVKTPQP